jgi:hypothetical protein
MAIILSRNFLHLCIEDMPRISQKAIQLDHPLEYLKEKDVKM